MKIRLEMFNEAGMHVNGRLTYTAAATIVRGDILKFGAGADAGKVTPCTAKTDAAVGVALDGAAEGEILSVAVLGSFAGTVVVKASAAVAQGAKITAVGATAEAGDGVVGVALDAATASGDLIEVAHCVQTTDGVAAD